MRVRHLPDIPSIMRLSEVISLELVVSGDEPDLTFGEMVPAPEAPEDVNEAMGSAIFAALSPGEERTIVVLKAEGYNHDSISYITGLPEAQIRRVMSQARAKVQALGIDRSTLH